MKDGISLRLQTIISSLVRSYVNTKPSVVVLCVACFGVSVFAVSMCLK